ncbi:nitrogen fixation protein NifU [Quadrisphaera granulorum]|uniref:Nitrogen fixation NifU-like protein n=1 Tax=Quadrisphaera granulorum TaxID=317664 RepID=A0A315ZRH5_9ACTN|nr:SUF system NifU family Fe-S cluster assembly protein [Quadrisphaera granulorum]PWJ47478.1 nitrogen fixation NifU-like protein [Quadrisphaera granulorum]SZE98779.1 nitrogen fixation protein NifU [Quadrisphaera granulorum]
MAGLDSLYQELILDHAKRRLGATDLAELPELTESTCGATSHQRNPICGDEITLRVTLDGEVVSDIAWEGLGCSISQASASMLTDLARGTTTAELAQLTEGFREAMRSKGQLPLDEERYGDAAALSGVSKFTARVKCAMLAWVALEDATRRARPTTG